MRGLRRLFRFTGRLNRRDYYRLEFRLQMLAGAGIIGALLLAALDVPRPLAAIPFLLIPISFVAWLAAWTRRMHDVGRHAWRQVLGALVGWAAFVGSLWLVVQLPPSDPVAIAFWAILTIGLITGLAFSFRRPPDWQLGDEQENEFGPPT